MGIAGSHGCLAAESATTRRHRQRQIPGDRGTQSSRGSMAGDSNPHPPLRGSGVRGPGVGRAAEGLLARKSPAGVWRGGTWRESIAGRAPRWPSLMVEDSFRCEFPVFGDLRRRRSRPAKPCTGNLIKSAPHSPYIPSASCLRGRTRVIPARTIACALEACMVAGTDERAGSYSL